MLCEDICFLELKGNQQLFHKGNMVSSKVLNPHFYCFEDKYFHFLYETNTYCFLRVTQYNSINHGWLVSHFSFFFFLEIRNDQSLAFECYATILTSNVAHEISEVVSRERKHIKKNFFWILFEVGTQITNVLPSLGYCYHILRGLLLSYDCNYQYAHVIRVPHQGLPVIMPKVICFKNARAP